MKTQTISRKLLPLLAFFVLLPVSALSQVQTYTNDFEGNVGLEWSHTGTDKTPRGKRGFLGQFGNQTVTLALTKDIPGVVTLEFDLFLINSWDGNEKSYGPDYFALGLGDGFQLLHTTFSNLDEYDWNQSYPNAAGKGDFPPGTQAKEKDSLGYTYHGDSVYHLKYHFHHKKGNFLIQFAASGLQELSDESWGIDNVVVKGAAAGSVLRGVRFFRQEGQKKVRAYSVTFAESFFVELHYRVPPGFDKAKVLLTWADNQQKEITVKPQFNPAHFSSQALLASSFKSDKAFDKLKANASGRTGTLRIADVIARIQGPDLMPWDAKADYKLVFYKGTSLKKWFPNVTWKIMDAGGRPIQLLKTDKSIKQTVKSPAPKFGFDAERFVLYAKTKVGPLLDGTTYSRSAKKYITITDAPKLCKELEAKIKEQAKSVGEWDKKVSDLENKRDAITIPKPIGDEKSKKLARDFVGKKSELKKAQAAVEKAVTFEQEIRKARTQLPELRKLLWYGMTEAARVGYASERYKKSKKTKKDKLDFVWGVLGHGAGVPKTTLDPTLDDAVMQAELVVRKTLVPRIGAGLVGIGGLVTIALPHSSPTNLSALAGFVIGTIVDTKLESSAFMKDLDLSIKELEAVNIHAQEVSRLANRVQKLRAEGAGKRKIEAVLVELHLKVIAAHDKTIDAVNAVDRVVPKAATLHREAKAHLKKIESDMKRLEAEIKKLSEEQEKRAYEIMDAHSKIELAQLEIDQAVETLRGHRSRLKFLRELHTRYCRFNLQIINTSH